MRRAACWWAILIYLSLVVYDPRQRIDVEDFPTEETVDVWQWVECHTYMSGLEPSSQTMTRSLGG